MNLAPLALAAALAAGGSDPALDLSLEPEEITVGDRIRVEIVLTVGAGEELRTEPGIPLEEGGRWGKAEVLAVDGPRQAPDPGEGVRRFTWTVTLTAWEPGSLEPPPLPVTLPGDPPRELHTPVPPAIRVASVLPEGESVEPRPPVPPRSWPAPSPWWWLLAPLTLLALVALVAWWRRRRSTEAPGAPVLTPRQRLDRAVERLRDLEEIEAIHTGISLALRRYLEEVLGFPAAEHTTTEIRRDLQATPLDRELRRDLLDLLHRCDDVKFARREVPLSVARGRIPELGALADRIEEILRLRSADLEEEEREVAP